MCKKKKEKKSKWINNPKNSFLFWETFRGNPNFIYHIICEFGASNGAILNFFSESQILNRPIKKKASQISLLGMFILWEPFRFIVMENYDKSLNDLMCEVEKKGVFKGHTRKDKRNGCFQLENARGFEAELNL